MTQLKQRIWRAIKRPDSDSHPEDMEWVGIGNIMRAAKLVNTLKFYRLLKQRRNAYYSSVDKLLKENGSLLTPRASMEKGFLLDDTGHWPHLTELLEECEKIINLNGMSRKGVPGREWIRDIMDGRFYQEFHSLLNFITSSDVLHVAMDYMKMVPVLSGTVPPGLRLTESYQDPETAATHKYAKSQLFHLDIHDTPMVYVIVLLRDTTEESGPFCFLDSEASERVVKALGYRKRHRPFRLTDEEVYGIIDRKEVRPLTGKAGTVLFLDPSRCFHFGSRKPVIPRYQAMFALVSPCRADFTEWYMKPHAYPLRESDSRLKRLVLDRFAD